MNYEQMLIPGARTSWVAVQVDIVGSGQIDEPAWVVQRIKESLHKLTGEIVTKAAAGTPLVFLKWAGDGGAVLMHAADGRACDRMVQAAIGIQEAMPAFNRELQTGELAVQEPVRLRVSVDCGIALYAPNPGNMHGGFLNRFLKNERALGRVHEVTLTAKVYQELNHSLRARFVEHFELPELGGLTMRRSGPLVKGLEHETEADWQAGGPAGHPLAAFETSWEAGDVEGCLRAFRRFARRLFGKAREDGELLYQAKDVQFRSLSKTRPVGADAEAIARADRSRIMVELNSFIRQNSTEDETEAAAKPAAATPAGSATTTPDQAAVPATEVKRFGVRREDGVWLGEQNTVEAFQVAPGDRLGIEAELGRTAYAYMVVIGPQGDVDLVYPARADEPPPLLDKAFVGGPVDRSKIYKLDSGPGFMMTALVASGRPLGTYMRSNLETAIRSVWARVVPTEPEALYFDDGASPMRKMTLQRAGMELKGMEEMSPEAGLVNRVTDALKPFGDSIRVIGFTVSEAARPVAPTKGELEKRVDLFLNALADPMGRCISDEKYQYGFSDEGRRKAKHVMEMITERFPKNEMQTERMGYLSLGGADGSELDYVLRNTPVRFGVLLEKSDKAAEIGRKRAEGLKYIGKTMVVLQGDALAGLGDATAMIRQAGLTGVICSAQAILHELPRRSPLFEKLGWSGIIGAIYQGFSQGAFIAREPAQPSWQGRVRLKVPGVPAEKWKKLAELIAGELGRHERGLQFGDLFLTGPNEVQLDALLAVETLHKVLRREETSPDDQVGRFLVEMGERLTSFDPSLLVQELAYRFHHKWPSQQFLATDGFIELYKKYGIEATEANRPTPLAMPQTHVVIEAIQPYLQG